MWGCVVFIRCVTMGFGGASVLSWLVGPVVCRGRPVVIDIPRSTSYDFSFANAECTAR